LFSKLLKLVIFLPNPEFLFKLATTYCGIAVIRGCIGSTGVRVGGVLIGGWDSKFKSGGSRVKVRKYQKEI
jgi:hypothetical protein